MRIRYPRDPAHLMAYPGAVRRQKSGPACAGCPGSTMAESNPSCRGSIRHRTLEKLHRIGTPEARLCKYQVPCEAAVIERHFDVGKILGEVVSSYSVATYD